MNYNFSLGGNFLFDILFQSSQHEGLEYRMQTFKLYFIEFALVETRCFNVFTKPLLKLFVVVKQFWHDEVE